MNTTKTLLSGRSLTILTPRLADAKELSKVVARELARVALKIESDDLKKLQRGDLAGIASIDMDVIKNLAFQLLGSDEVERVVHKLMTSATYGEPDNEQRISAATWEDEKNREDYFEVAWEVSKNALRPFFSNLLSLLFSRAVPAGEVPKSGVN